jgi:hypothetical protein
VFIQSCENEKVPESTSAVEKNENTTSPYYGWFKDKNEFSFVSVSITIGVVNETSIENTVTSYYYVKDGKEAVREVTVAKFNNDDLPAEERIFITSSESNYVLNPLSKKYIKEAGDCNAAMYSKVWVWTRKRSDSYDELSSNSSAVKSSVKIGDIETTCFTISGANFYFDTEKKLVKYNGSAGGMDVTITFNNYKESGIAGFAAESITKISSEEYTLVNDLYSLR